MSRIPLDHPPTPLVRLAQWYSRRAYGEVLDPALAALHNRRVLATALLTEGSVRRWRSLNPTVQALAVMACASSIGCTWCMDFGYWESSRRGVDGAKLRDVPTWRNSGAYSPLERLVMEYAEAMTATPPTVSDELVGQLRARLSDEQLIELTALVALENQRSRVNAALGLTSQGFKEHCELATL